MNIAQEDGEEARAERLLTEVRELHESRGGPGVRQHMIGALKLRAKQARDSGQAERYASLAREILALQRRRRR